VGTPVTPLQALTMNNSRMCSPGRYRQGAYRLFAIIRMIGVI
jgi:hypothetical protein